MLKTDLLIIGAGPGGMSAALSGAEMGLESIVLDENPAPGGQIYRDRAEGLTAQGRGPETAINRAGQALKKRFKAHKRAINHLHKITVWGIFPDKTVAVSDGHRTYRIGFKKLVIAAGAYDRPVPFPGWTLPGVMTAGGAQRLVKTMGVIPGQRIVLAGSGPLQIALASQILKKGGEIVALVEAGRVGNPLPALAALPGNLALLKELAGYLKTLLRHRVKIQTGWLISRAEGENRLEGVSLAEVDRNWRPLNARRQTIAADTLCLGYGLVPGTELSQLAGCEHLTEPGLGGLVPQRDALLQTSMPSIFAIGDGAGVRGSKTAIIEGELAALAIAWQLGLINGKTYLDRSLPLKMSKIRLLKLKKALDAITTPGPGLYELADDQTIICRCEGVRLGDFKEAIAKGGQSTNDLKRLTRCGMGRCQGRICGPILENLDLGNGRPLHRRPPLRPIPLGVLANAASEDLKESGHAA